MPRLSPRLLDRSYIQNPLLPLLLRTCRDLPSAKNELRWLREHAIHLGQASQQGRDIGPLSWDQILRALCKRRAKGVPLQYILGTQPFGELEILCRSGVLIPRPETEEWTTYTASKILDLILHAPRQSTEAVPRLRILDLCTGTGCISLLLHSLLHKSFPDLHILGLDIEPRALKLARSNLRHNIREGLLHPSAQNQVSFQQADILDQSFSPPPFDVVVSNPPYISRRDFGNGQTSHSVRRYEPLRALVPPLSAGTGTSRDPEDGDLFYPRLLETANNVGAKLAAVEVGGIEQARRVATMAIRRYNWARIEIWRDQISSRERSCEEVVDLDGRPKHSKGAGNGRVIACWRT